MMIPNLLKWTQKNIHKKFISIKLFLNPIEYLKSKKLKPPTLQPNKLLGRSIFHSAKVPLNLLTANTIKLDNRHVFHTYITWTSCFFYFFM